MPAVKRIIAAVPLVYRDEPTPKKRRLTLARALKFNFPRKAGRVYKYGDWIKARCRQYAAEVGWHLGRSRPGTCKRHGCRLSCMRDNGKGEFEGNTLGSGKGEYYCDKCMDEMVVYSDNLRHNWFLMGRKLKDGYEVYDDEGHRVWLP